MHPAKLSQSKALVSSCCEDNTNVSEESLSLSFFISRCHDVFSVFSCHASAVRRILAAKPNINERFNDVLHARVREYAALSLVLVISSF